MWKPAEQLAAQFFPKVRRVRRFVTGDVAWSGAEVLATTPSNLVHEVAHFQVAGEWRRWMKNYGLGSSPDDFSGVPAVTPLQRSIYEETLASALGIYWEHTLGYEWWTTAYDHGWSVQPCKPQAIETFARVARYQTRHLSRLGLLDRKLKPRTAVAPSWRAPRKKDHESW